MEVNDYEQTINISAGVFCTGKLQKLCEFTHMFFACEALRGNSAQVKCKLIFWRLKTERLIMITFVYQKQKHAIKLRGTYHCLSASGSDCTLKKLISICRASAEWKEPRAWNGFLAARLQLHWKWRHQFGSSRGSRLLTCGAPPRRKPGTKEERQRGSNRAMPYTIKIVANIALTQRTV